MRVYCSDGQKACIYLHILNINKLADYVYACAAIARHAAKSTSSFMQLGLICRLTTHLIHAQNKISVLLHIAICHVIGSPALVYCRHSV